jgi:hypothetical protein
MEAKPDVMARRGLELGGRALRRLREVGIYARSEVSLEYQNLARRYVIRGVESGGAIAELGRYVTFAGERGEPLPYLQPLDALGVNGVHAVVVASVLVRVEVFRAGRTYQLLITEHQPGSGEKGRRPRLESRVLFRGTDGFLDLELWKADRKLTGSVLPQFFTRGGEAIEIPEAFHCVAMAATCGACCLGCSHCHYLVERRTGSRAPAAAGSKSGLSELTSTARIDRPDTTGVPEIVEIPLLSGPAGKELC